MKKIFITLSSIATVAAPIAATISCGSDDIDYSKIITIQAEKSWVATYQKIITKFKKDHASDLKAQGIKDIVVLEGGSFDSNDNLKNKGFRDESVADVFLLVGDRIQSNVQNLKTFSKNDWEAFQTKYSSYMGKATLKAAAQSTQDIAIRNRKMYGLVQNIEALIQLQHPGASAPKILTRLADLWFSVGFFNTSSFNLKDIVSTNDVGQIVNGVTAKKQELVAGFKRIIDVARAVGFNDVDLLNKDSGTAGPKVIKYFEDNQDISLIVGPWDLDSKGQLSGTKIVPSVIAPPSNYKQWGGGWLYALNKRITTQEQDIAEKLIATILNKDNAVAIWKGANKLSPTAEGETAIVATSELNKVQKEVAAAIYDANILKKPIDQAFNAVWGVYTTIISSNVEDIIDTTKTPATLAGELAQKFIDALTIEIDKFNSET